MSYDRTPQQRAIALFDTLVELPEPERQARLSQLRSEDASLAAALAELLRADAESSGLLDRGVQEMVGNVVEHGAMPLLDANAQIGAFTLLRVIGRGGMGEVWLAERRDGAFVQQVALKLLKRGMDSDAVTARFVQERRILAELNHPHIARFIDGGLSGDGRPYFAMEYVVGENLIDYANARQLGVRDRVRMLAAVCDAVAYAQAHLVVHRDLKPSNILVDDNGQPRVLDFGIAKLLGDSAPEADMTQTGVRALSPRYAAPEQVLGESISTATDVYALGTILFELLTGTLPHQRDSLPLEALAAQVKSEQAAAPSSVLRRGATSTQNTGTTQGMHTARVVREVAGDLDTVVLTALQREPERRYANAAALADDLRRWLEARPIAAQADTRGYRLRKFVARNRLAVGSASAVLLALLAGLTVALWQAQVARGQAELARSESRRAEQAAEDSAEAAARTRRVKDFLMQTFIGVDPMLRPEGAPQTVDAAFDDALKRIDTDVVNDPKLQIDLLDDFGEVRINQGRFDEARVLLDRALALAEKHYPADDPVIAETLLNRASLASFTGQMLDSAADVERAVAILQPHEAELPGQYSMALSGLSALRNAQGRAEEYLALAMQNLELARKHLAPGSLEYLSALNQVSVALVELGRHGEAESYANEFVREAEKIGGPSSPLLENALSVLSQVYYRQGKTAESMQVDERRLAIMRAAFPKGHPGTADVLTDVGWEAYELGDYDKARRSFDEAIEIATAHGSSRVIMTLRYRALMEAKLGNLPAALADFDRASAPCISKALAITLCTVVRTNRAGLLAKMGRGQEAMREVDAVIAELTTQNLLGDNEYAQALESKAAAFSALGQPDQARETQKLAIARYVAIFGAGHTEVKRAERGLERYSK
jgi:eukaryotic-like serine/threonine-protein kinase